MEFPRSMASAICCFRCNRDNSSNVGHVRLHDIPTVRLDTGYIGTEVVIVKNGRRICGTGAALGNAPIVQNKAYFEAKVQATGVWGIGLASRRVNLNSVPLGQTDLSWVLRHDGCLMHNNTLLGKLEKAPEEGDVIGVSYDHVELNFYINGDATNLPITGIKGTLYPVVYVDDSATMDVFFTGFYNPPPPGFEEIMFEKSLL